MSLRKLILVVLFFATLTSACTNSLISDLPSFDDAGTLQDPGIILPTDYQAQSLSLVAQKSEWSQMQN